MQTTSKNARIIGLGLLTAMCCVSCDFDVPITAQPTRKVEEKLLGDWVAVEGGGPSTEGETNVMKVRKFDESNYVVQLGEDLYRAYHSDLGKAPFLSVEIIEHSNRKFSYMTWDLSADGKQLRLMRVDTTILNKEQADTSAKVQKILKKNLTNPNLFPKEGVLVFTNKNPLTHGLWK